jgi:hypothetical protein
MHRRALDGREKILGPKHPYTLAHISNLRSVSTHQCTPKVREKIRINNIICSLCRGTLPEPSIARRPSFINQANRSFERKGKIRKISPPQHNKQGGRGPAHTLSCRLLLLRLKGIEKEYGKWGGCVLGWGQITVFGLALGRLAWSVRRGSPIGRCFGEPGKIPGTIGCTVGRFRIPAAYRSIRPLSQKKKSSPIIPTHKSLCESIGQESKKSCHLNQGLSIERTGERENLLLL